MSGLSGLWSVTRHQTERILFSSPINVNQSMVLVHVTNKGTNPVNIKFDGLFHIPLQPNESTSLIHKSISVIAQKPDGSDAATPSDNSALDSHGEFVVTPLLTCPAPLTA